ncbi:hypothetical protein DU976_16770 [Vibrio navarrensis]|nr:hypothetical protein [Vibrio navarrensis]EHA1123554.1 hypothetical protein [Vibrio navarrensis]
MWFECGIHAKNKHLPHQPILVSVVGYEYDQYLNVYFLLVALSLERRGILTFFSCWKVAKDHTLFISSSVLVTWR